MFEHAKKVWTMLGTFGLVKPLGLLALGVAGSGGAAAFGTGDLVIVMVLLAVSSAAGIVVVVFQWRKFPTLAFFHQAQPVAPKPVPVPEPEPWKWTAEVLPRTPAVLDPPRVFVAGTVIERSDEKV